MPVIQCPINGCDYETTDVEAAVAAALLITHNVHTTGLQPTTNKQRPPKLDRPKITKGSSEETWNTFQTRWQMFRSGTQITAEEAVQHLFQCCEDSLGDEILQNHKDAVTGTEDNLMKVVKKLAVAPVAVSVRRSELLSIKQDHGENTRSFFATLVPTRLIAAVTHATEMSISLM